MWVKRLWMPILLAAVAALGAFAGLALAEDPPPANEIEATAEQIDCSTLGMTDEQERKVEDCWDTEVISVPPGATELEIALAEQAALCDAVDEVEARPDFCVISDAAIDDSATP